LFKNYPDSDQAICFRLIERNDITSSGRIFRKFSILLINVFYDIAVTNVCVFKTTAMNVAVKLMPAE